jgi:hypothetical protein
MTDAAGGRRAAPIRPTPAIPRGWSSKDLARLAVVAEAFANDARPETAGVPAG